MDAAPAEAPGVCTRGARTAKFSTHCVSRPVFTDGGVKRTSAPPVHFVGGAALGSRRFDLPHGGLRSWTRRCRSDLQPQGPGDRTLPATDQGAIAGRRLRAAVLRGDREDRRRRPGHRPAQPPDRLGPATRSAARPGPSANRRSPPTRITAPAPRDRRVPSSPGTRSRCKRRASTRASPSATSPPPSTGSAPPNVPSRPARGPGNARRPPTRRSRHARPATSPRPTTPRTNWRRRGPR